jgi:TPR repeat protein
MKLGMLYERGIGVRRDPPAAVQCYAKAAAGGHADARAAIMRCQS